MQAENMKILPKKITVALLSMTEDMLFHTQETHYLLFLVTLTLEETWNG